MAKSTLKRLDPKYSVRIKVKTMRAIGAAMAQEIRAKIAHCTLERLAKFVPVNINMSVDALINAALDEVDKKEWQSREARKA